MIKLRVLLYLGGIVLIYTSYFGKLKKLPNNITPISICGKAPNWYTGIQYKKLAPKWNFFRVWKENHNNDFYICEFNKQVLDGLDANEVYNELKQLSPTEDFALICYEKPEDFCHRHLVADWFRKNNIPCKEFAELGEWLKPGAC